MPSVWIPASEAYRRLETHCGPIQAARSICSRAHDSLISARARRIVTNGQDRENALVPADFWWARGEARLIQNWVTGDFETTDYAHGERRAYGVEFSREEFEAMVPSEHPETTVVGEDRQPRVSQRWHRWVAELAYNIHSKGYPPGVGSDGQEELIQRVAAALTEQGEAELARTTVQPVVQAVLDRFRSADKT